MQQYFINDKLKNKQSILIPSDIKHHLLAVLRTKPNKDIRLVDDENKVFLAHIQDDKLIIKEEILENRELDIKIIAIITLIKNDKFELILQKLVELGVSEIIALETKRSIIKIKDRDAKLKRWQKIILEACCQCNRSVIPVFNKFYKIADLKDLKVAQKFVCYENSREKFKFDRNQKDIAFVIGPEGGFELNEISELKTLGFKEVSLGKRILRAETSALYFISNIVGYYE